MKVNLTRHNTHEIAWSKGALEINLIPVNGALKTTVYAGAGFGGQLICLHDNVGITNLRLGGCPPVPRICWDNREHHFWRGFNGGFRPRNTVINDVSICHAGDDSSVRVSCYYIVDHVKTTLTWVFREPEDDISIMWDTLFLFENLTDQAMEGYMAFFACYHQPGTNYYWDDRDRISACADSFKGFLNSEKKLLNSEICAAFSEQVKGWSAGIANPVKAEEIYGNPVLLSEAREWFAGGRHILMVEPKTCLNITSAMRQARDYMLSPPEMCLRPRASFASRVRHVITRMDGISELGRLWKEFAEG